MKKHIIIGKKYLILKNLIKKNQKFMKEMLKIMKDKDKLD